MPDLDLEPHEFRPSGRPRLWGKRMVIQFGLVALGILAGAVWLLVSRSDAIDPAALWLFALFTWPWVLVIGAAIGHLAPQFYFQDDKQD